MEFEIHLECCLSLARRSLSIPYQDGCERSDQVFASPSFSSFLFLFRFVVCFSSTVGSRPNRFRENKHSKTDCHVEFRVGFPNANRILDKETSNFGPQKMRFLRVTQLKSLVPPPPHNLVRNISMLSKTKESRRSDISERIAKPNEE